MIYGTSYNPGWYASSYGTSTASWGVDINTNSYTWFELIQPAKKNENESRYVTEEEFDDIF